MDFFKNIRSFREIYDFTIEIETEITGSMKI